MRIKVHSNSIPKGWFIARPTEFYVFDEVTSLIVLFNEDGYRAWNVDLNCFSSPCYDDEELFRRALVSGAAYIDRYDYIEDQK